MTKSRSETVSRLQELAKLERIANPDEDDAIISAALGLHEDLDERRRRRVARERRQWLFGALLVGLVGAAAFWWWRSS